MSKLNPMSFKVTKTQQSIKIKELFGSNEVAIRSQDSENDNNIFIATNPNSTHVRTDVLAPTVTDIIANNYLNFSDSGMVTVEGVSCPFYTSSDIVGITVGETVTISQGATDFDTTVKAIDSGDIILNPVDGLTPANTDLLIFNHSTWYYICSTSLDKVAVGDKVTITVDDDSSVKVREVVYKDATHIGILTQGLTNFTAGDTLLFQADTKLDELGLVLASNDYPNGLKVIHSTTDSTVFNLTIIPKTDDSNVKFFFSQISLK